MTSVKAWLMCREQRTFGKSTWRCTRRRHFDDRHYMSTKEAAMAQLPNGHVMSIEGLPGRWQVWSQSGNTPGAYFFVPSNDEARDAGIKFAEVRVIYSRSTPKPTTKVINIEKRHK